MGKHDVDIRIKARDEASKAFRSAGASAFGFDKTMNSVAGSIRTILGGLAIGTLVRKAVMGFAEEEQAVVELDQALRNLGDTSDESRLRAVEFAGSIQKVSVYGDETVIQLQALGANLGKLTGTQLERATKAALGLSRAFKMDATAAMRLVSRAAQGQTQTLSRYGIVLDANLTPQQKFNQLLLVGEKHFSEMTTGVKTFTEEMKMMGNVAGDTMEKFGAILVGAGQAASGEYLWMGKLRAYWQDVNEQLDSYIQLRDELKQMDAKAENSLLGGGGGQKKDLTLGKGYASSYQGAAIDSLVKRMWGFATNNFSARGIMVNAINGLMDKYEKEYYRKKNIATIGDIAINDIGNLFKEDLAGDKTNMSFPFRIPTQAILSVVSSALGSAMQGMKTGLGFMQAMEGEQYLRQTKVDLLRQQSLAGSKEARLQLASLAIEEEMLPIRKRLREVIQNQFISESQRMEAQKIMAELEKVEAARVKQTADNMKDTYHAGYIPGLQFQESRFLTLGHGSRNRMEDNTTRMVRQLDQSNRLLTSLDKKINSRSGVSAGGYELKEAKLT